MKSFSDVVSSLSHYEALNSRTTALDFNQDLYVDYTPQELQKVKGSKNYIAEDNYSSGYVQLSSIIQEYSSPRSVFGFFIDGTRRMYLGADRLIGGVLAPEVLAHCSVVCTKRIEGALKVLKVRNELVHSLCDEVVPEFSKNQNTNKDKFINELIEIFRESNQNILSKLPHDISVLFYNRSQSDRIGVDLLTVAKGNIQSHMNMSEIDLITEVNDLLCDEKMLLKDGSIDYPFLDKKYKSHIAKIGITEAKFINQFRYVVGVSKTFNPELLKTKNKTLAEDILNLGLFERTPVYAYVSERTSNRLFIWYIRIRNRLNKKSHPFEGVLKVELLDISRGEDFPKLSSDLVNRISVSLINERNPTTYGKEGRWSNHLYPIYLTESYIKSLTLSKYVISRIL